jgi:hypothetical protein
VIPWLPNVGKALDFFGLGAPVLAWTLGATPLLATVVAWRRHRSLFPVVCCTAWVTVVSLPVILTIAEAKAHFFHPRHALFLLPLLLVMLGVALAGLAEALVPARLGVTRRPVVVATTLAAALALVAPAVQGYVEAPWRFFTYTKNLQDFRGIAQLLHRRTRTYAPEDRYLLVVTRDRKGYLGNPVLAWYLEWYGIRDRVVMRGTARPADVMQRTGRRCQRHCRNLDAALEHDLRLEGAFQLSRPKRHLLGKAVMRRDAPARLQHIGFAIYPPLERFELGALDDYRVVPHFGLLLYELVRSPDRDHVRRGSAASATPVAVVSPRWLRVQTRQRTYATPLRSNLSVTSPSAHDTSPM